MLAATQVVEFLVELSSICKISNQKRNSKRF